MRFALITITCGLILAGTISPVFAADTDAAATLLKDRGLKKVGTTYVLSQEADVQKKLNDARLLGRQMNLALEQQQSQIAASRENQMMIRELTQQRIMLNQQLAQQLPPAQHNQLVAVVNTVTDRLNLLRQAEIDAQSRPADNGSIGKSREAYVQAIIELRQTVDAATKAYEELNKDKDVVAAIAAIGGATKSKPTLGPSKAFLSNVKLLEKAEALVLSETVELRKQGGIYWLDVMFNGKVTKPMAFDTGASSVVLPADMAAEIGLKPGPNDPIVKCQVADGSIVEARKMNIPSIRVGKFTIQDVECTVMPADKKDVPPLLGQTFQKNFMIKFSPEAGSLTLSRVETGEAPATGAKTKATTKSSTKATSKKSATKP